MMSTCPQRKWPTHGAKVLYSSYCPPVFSCGILNTSTVLWHHLFKWRAGTTFCFSIPHVCPQLSCENPSEFDCGSTSWGLFSSSRLEEWNLWTTINQFTGLIALGRMIGVKANWVCRCHCPISRLVLNIFALFH